MNVLCYHIAGAAGTFGVRTDEVRANGPAAGLSSAPAKAVAFRDSEMAELSLILSLTLFTLWGPER